MKNFVAHPLVLLLTVTQILAQVQIGSALVSSLMSIVIQPLRMFVVTLVRESTSFILVERYL